MLAPRGNFMRIGLGHRLEKVREPKERRLLARQALSRDRPLSTRVRPWAGDRDGGVAAKGLREHVPECLRFRRPLSDRSESPFVYEVLEQTRMVEDRLDDTPGRIGRHQERGYAHPELIERVFFLVVVRRNSPRRRHVVIEAAVLIVQDNEKRV